MAAELKTVAKLVIELTLLTFINALVINKSVIEINGSESSKTVDNLTDVFNGVYVECFLHLSYMCVQNKTLLYLKELNKLPEVSVLGEFAKFVKLNKTEYGNNNSDDDITGKNTEDLSFLIDRAVDKFFNNHVLKFSAMGRDISVPNAAVDGFVGRKKRKGGGGGGGHGGGHDDGGKKKMMMMAMMCMKMKLMMMVPAMMGMMGMMSFKGMMFSMMSFMVSKMMLLMKLLEKKGVGGIGASGAGADGGWPAGGGGGGAWMPAGGDYGGGGGYDANGQWQSRSIFETQKPVISYVAPLVRFNKNILEPDSKAKSRKRRGIIDVIQNAYEYWFNRILGSNISRRRLKQPTYKVVNGIKYVYYPMKTLQKIKAQKDLQTVKAEELKPIVITDEYNKGEIMEMPTESRMNRKKFNKIKDTVNETVDDNPWE